MHRITGLSALAFVWILSSGAQAAPAGLDCPAMTSVPLPSSAIGLPTSGARVTAATHVDASGTPPRSVGAYCRVTAEIGPVDPSAPPIKLEVNLPESWNGKALMYGGGGFNGSLLSSPGTIRLQPTDVAVPLGRGYATFSGDSGHTGASTDGSFAINDEALRNYAYDAVRKTRDVAGALIAARYGRPADKVYFHGSSNGGKEALGMMQRNPADLDGAIVFWPAVNFTELALQHARITRALLQPDAYPSVAQRHLLLDAAIAACDARDGATDGVIADAHACQSAFDPATARVEGRSLRCGDGNADDGCLSDRQIAALRLMGTPFGGDGYPGFDIWGTDLGSRTDTELARNITAQGLGTVPSGYPTQPGMPFMQNFADQFFKYAVARDPAAALPDFDPEHPGRWKQRLEALASMMDLGDPDLSAFAAHGGKVIILHGMADQIIPVKGTERYVGAVEQKMGRDRVHDFLKFYELPATAHSGNSLAFMPTWDALGALDAWVTTGEAPKSPVVVDSVGKPGRTRPLCEFPTIAVGPGPVRGPRRADPARPVRDPARPLP